MENAYNQIKLIECNRAGSIEAKANQNDNPALFTNEISEGLTLQPLDRISVHSSFVSEIGCGSDTIEIKGDLIKEYEFKDITRFIASTGAEYYPDNISFIDGHTVSNVGKKVKIYDNQFKWVIQYYKNNNGENHIYLPRNYNWHFTAQAGFGDNWVKEDTATTGRVPSAPDHTYTLKDDFRYDETNQLYKIRTDNKRFTAFVRTKTIYNASISPILINNDPATDDYIIYQELLELEVPKGFNNPNKIASLLTEQLKQSDTPKILKIKDPNNNKQELSVLTINNALTFKTFTAANYDGWTSAAYVKYQGPDAAFDQSALDHYNTYEYVFYKRPEIQQTGRQLNDAFGVELSKNTQSNTDLLYLDYSYSDDNCKLFLDFFDAQSKYPEIWTNENISNLNASAKIKNSRFIHINNVNDSTDFGNDGNVSYGANNQLETKALFCLYNDEQRNITADEATSEEYSYNPLNTTYAYGFAIPYRNVEGGDLKIALNIAGISGTIPAHYLITGKIDRSRLVGFDYHFNAYSTCALSLISGIGYYTVDAATQVGIKVAQANVSTSKYFTGAYIGADNPQIDFDNNEFKILNLHSAENTGQPSYTVGDSGNTNAAQIVSAPGNVVFRINKPLNFSIFTPDSKPYSETTSVTYGAKARNIREMNKNMEPWVIFDSRSGIFINKDIGLNENEFNKSLYKTLGFNYNQWVKPSLVNSTNNRLSRISNINYNNLDIITTNCSIVSDESVTFDVSKFGATFFNHIIAYPSIVEGIGIYPLIVTDTSSYPFKADSLALRMQKPYYTIRSSLIDDNVQYIGNSKNSKAKMPIIAVVNKINGEGDYFFGTGSEFEFVVTQEKTITSIKTALLDPDASYINCNNDSAVIYKIQ
jgi:hypothetical protein